MGVPELLDKILSNDHMIIGIDGELGAGKSFLAKNIGSKYQCSVVNIDHFCEIGTGKYVGSINFNQLLEHIEKSAKPVIVEGVCLLDVLDRLNIKADVHIFLYSEPPINYKSNSKIVSEVTEYILRTDAKNMADMVLNMNQQTNNSDVDIAYLKAKTIVAVVLGLGGITALIVGAIILTAGISSQNSVVFESQGIKVTAEGIGAVILGSSVFWAYFSYLSRPVYARRRESISKQLPDGTSHSEERETSTMALGDRK